MLKVYSFSKVNGMARTKTRDLRVLWALEEMGLPYEVVGMDHPAHALETDAYGALSPFHQIPAIDDDGILVSESGAILVYLAKKSGKLIPIDPAGEAQVLRWCFAALSTVEIPLVSLTMIDWVEEKSGATKYRGFMNGYATRVLGNLEKWLDHCEFVATSSFTVADILLTHVLSVFEDEMLLEPYTKVRAYRDRCLARPAWKRAFESYAARVEAA